MVLAGRMLLVALVVGTAVSVAATERIDVSLVIGASLAWSVVPAAQLMTGLFLIGSSRLPRMALLEAYFATHWPWSLWILSASGVLLVVTWSHDRLLWLLPSAAIPAMVTGRLLTRFCRERLDLSHQVSRHRVAAHQAVTLSLAVVAVAVAVALWPRLVGLTR